MSAQPNPNPSRSGLVFLCCLWLAAAASAQDDPTGPLAEARALAFAGRPEQAVPLYQRLAAEIEQQEGRDAWSLVFPLYELAVQHHILGALGEAESHYRRSLAIAESHRGARDPALVPSLRGLATIAATRGRLGEAESFYGRALEIQEAGGGSPKGTAKTLAELGLLSQLQGRSEDAERFYRRALALGEASHLEEAEIAIISGNLGALYAEQERYAESEPLFRRALEIRERSLGPEHPDLARFHDKLGSLRYRGRRFAEAASSYERSLRIREQAGQADVAVAEVLGRLAACYRQLGRSAEAEAHFGMARAILDAQCSGREGTGPCRDAIWNHRDLTGERPVAPAEPVPSPVPAKIADAPPPSPPAAPSSPAPPVPAPVPSSEPAPSAGAQQPAVAETPAASPVPPPPDAEAPAASPPPPSPSPSPPTAAGAPGGKVHRAQVGAREDPHEAAELLAQLRDSHPQLLGDLAWRVVRADLGERGVWHRIQIGEFRGVAEAKDLCAALVRQGHDGCWVITTED